jgi:hypothetical protein
MQSGQSVSHKGRIFWRFQLYDIVASAVSIE